MEKVSLQGHWNRNWVILCRTASLEVSWSRQAWRNRIAKTSVRLQRVRGACLSVYLSDPFSGLKILREPVYLSIHLPPPPPLGLKFYGSPSIYLASLPRPLQFPNLPAPLLSIYLPPPHYLSNPFYLSIYLSIYPSIYA